jgi:hypothetical protein
VVDLGNSSSKRYAIRLDTFTEGPTEQHFKVHINSWSDTILYNARVSWFMLGNTKAGLQCGNFKAGTLDQLK